MSGKKLFDKSQLMKRGLLIMHLKPTIQSCFSCSGCSQKHLIGFFKGCWNSVICTTWLLLFQIVLVIKFPAFLVSASYKLCVTRTASKQWLQAGSVPALLLSHSFLRVEAQWLNQTVTRGLAITTHCAIAVPAGRCSRPLCWASLGEHPSLRSSPCSFLPPSPTLPLWHFYSVCIFTFQRTQSSQGRCV